MAYDRTKYQLTQLLQDAWYKMGQIKKWTLTGGSATTSINSVWAGVEEQIFEDDDPALIYGTVVCIESTDHLSPEGEYGMVTDYDSSTNTLTHGALSAVLQSGDKIGIASPLFPVDDMIELANIALQKLGEIDVPDYVNTTAGAVSYTLPSTIRSYPILVRYLSPNALIRPRVVSGWSVSPMSPGTSLVIVVPGGFDESGGRLEVFYKSLHPKVTSFDSTISEFISPELALSALVAEAYEWYNNQLGGSNQYFLQRENKALQDLEAALVKSPIHRLTGQVSGMPHWGGSTQYVPLTNDARY